MTLVVPAFGGRRRVVAASPAAQDELKIVFVGVTGGGSDAMVDAGAMSQTRAKRGRGARAVSVTRRVFGIRIDAANAGEGAKATLRAYLESHDGRSTIRIDGIELSTIPKIIDAHSPIGIATTHTIEIEVPASAPEGAFASAVRWDVETN